MSWDKNTLSFSSVGAVRDVLKDLAVPYQLSVIATFRGRGCNDDPYMDGTDTIYELRRLQYGAKVILEYAELDTDCDVDDMVFSQEYKLEDEPQDWVAIRKTDKLGQYFDYEEDKPSVIGNAEK